MAGNGTVGSLNVELTANTVNFETGLKNAETQLNRFAAVNGNVAGRVAGQSKAIQQAGLNLSRQFTDIGVSLAGGSSPFLVLTQQLPQVADAFSQAKSQGVGFGAVVKGLAGGIRPMIPLLAGVGLAAGAVVGAFGLFERAVDKQTKGATKFGDTWKATLNVVGKAIMEGPIGDGLKFLGAAVGRVLDAITGAFTGALDQIVGQFGAAFSLITTNWRRLPEVFGVLIQAAANNVIRGVEALVNGAIGGLNTLLKAAGKAPIGVIDLPEIKLANAKLSAEFEKTSARVSASFKAGREGFLAKIVKETERLAAANKKGAKEAGDHAKSTKQLTDAQEDLRKAVAGVLEALETDAERTLRTYNEQVAILRQGFEAGIISSEQFADALDRLWAAEKNAIVPLKEFKGELFNLSDEAEKAGVGVDNLADRIDALSEHFSDAKFAFGDLLGSLKSGDIGRVLQNIQSLGSGVQGLLNGGAAGVASLGSIVANTIGGRTGRAVGGGLGLAATGLGLGAFAGSAAGAAALGTVGLGSLAALAPILGPIGLAAGALYAAAKIFNVGGKPSNNGAGFSLVNGQLSGSKRTPETEGAARAAGDAITGIQDALKAAGIGLTDAVHGLVIGTRDQTQIYLNSGKVLRSAVGDSGAAVDAALSELLTGATYVSEAQRKLVESALATGKGFDAVAEVLAKYEAAQKISGELADRILALTDPKAFNLDQVKEAIDAERDAAKQLAADGVLTADQLTTINGQLDRLQALQIDEVLARFAVDIEDAGEAARRAAELQAEAAQRAAELQVEAAEAQLDTAQGTYEDAVRALEESHEDQVEALTRTRDALNATADSLADFRRDVAAEAAAGNPARVLSAARTAFAANTDPAKIPELGRALLSASKAGATTALEQARDRANVLKAAQAAEVAARAQASALDRQITALNAQVGALIPLTTAVQSVDVSIQKLEQATAGLAAAQAAVAAAIGAAATLIANDNVAASAAARTPGPDVAAIAASVDALGSAGATAGTSMAPGEASVDALLRQVVVNTGLTARTMDDVTQGGDTLRTESA